MSLLNHLVSPEHQQLGDRQAKRLGSLEVNDQLEFRRLLHGQLSGLGTPKDLVHEGRGPSNKVREAGSVGHQPTRHHRPPVPEHCRQAAPGREVG